MRILCENQKVTNYFYLVKNVLGNYFLQTLLVVLAKFLNMKAVVVTEKESKSFIKENKYINRYFMNLKTIFSVHIVTTNLIIFKK